MAQPPTRLVELEDRLAQDTDGALREALLAEWQGTLQRLQGQLARGGTPEQYARWTAAGRAVAAAIEVLQQVRLAQAAPVRAGPAENIKGD